VQLGKGLLYILYVISIVTAILYGIFWYPFIEDLKERRRPNPQRFSSVRHVTSKAFRRLGGVHPRKESHFVNFPREKVQSNVRICALGDSNTYGDEVGPRHDYPSYLQRLFNKHGIKNVEVINFGNSWYGFGQTFLMWEHVAKDFQCDFVLLVPFSWWWMRDTTFNHSSLIAPYYLHARYVLDGEGLNLVEVIGDSDEDRFRNYFRLIPRYRYLRYDRNPVTLLRAIIPNRGLRNPFYYDRRPPKAEAFEIYTKIVNQMADSDTQILVGVFGEDDIEVPMRAIRQGNVVLLKSFNLGGFPYLTPIFHQSPWGNEVRARLFFRGLVSNARYDLPIIKTSDEVLLQGRVRAQPLFDYDSLTIELNTETVGVVVSLDERRQEDQARFRSTLSGTGIVALLALKLPGQSVADACLVPLWFQPKGNAPIYLKDESGRESGAQEWGRVRFPNSRVNIAVVDVGRIRCPQHGPLVYRGKGNGPVRLKNGQDYTVTLSGVEILKGTAVKGKLRLSPQKGSLYRMRALGDYLAEVDNLPASGTFDIALEGPKRERIVEPIVRWRKYQRTDPITLSRPLQRTLYFENGSAKIQYSSGQDG